MDLIHKTRVGLQRLYCICNLRLRHADICPRTHQPQAAEHATEYRVADLCDRKLSCVDAT